MIVALVGSGASAPDLHDKQESNRKVADLAEELALLRVAAGSRVLLVCPGPGAYDPTLYDDLVIDASREATPLAGAAVIVALLGRDELDRLHCDAPGHDALADRLRAACAANPGARVLVTVAHGSAPLTPHQVGNALVFVARIPGARLADTLVLDHDTHASYHSRHSELERDSYKSANVLCAPEVRHLYRQVFSQG